MISVKRRRMQRSLLRLLLAFAALVLVGVLWTAGRLANRQETAPAETPAPSTTQSVALGPDVSFHQGLIDWNAAAGQADFAFLRLGYRAYGQSAAILPDDCFSYNFSQAQAAGLDVGVYFFSQAITVQEAVEEAQYVLDTLDGVRLALPIVLDFEFVAGDEGRLESAGLSREAATHICRAFLDTVEAAGYAGMLYSNPDMLSSTLDQAALLQEYPLWLSSWTEDATAEFPAGCVFWQFTSSGQLEGITGGVDLNYRLLQTPAVVENVSAQVLPAGGVTVSWAKVPGAWGYRIWRQHGSEWVLADELSGPATVSWTDPDLPAGQRFSYRVTSLLVYNGQIVESTPSTAEAVVTGIAEIAVEY